MFGGRKQSFCFLNWQRAKVLLKLELDTEDQVLLLIFYLIHPPTNFFHFGRLKSFKSQYLNDFSKYGPVFLHVIILFLGFKNNLYQHGVLWRTFNHLWGCVKMTPPPAFN